MKSIAAKRAMQGTGASRRLRHAGKVPGIIYGGTASRGADRTGPQRAVPRVAQGSLPRLHPDMNVDGAKESRCCCATPDAPVQAAGAAHRLPARRRQQQDPHEGAAALRQRRHCAGRQDRRRQAAPHRDRTRHPVPAGSLPEFIDVDMGALEVGHSIHANDLQLPAGVELVAHVKAENPAVASVSAPKGAGAAEEAPAA